ncbi:MAG: M48 family metallopeptidase [Archangium sp.]|nr:M48 family metallopeptidase [Archangium sp.]
MEPRFKTTRAITALALAFGFLVSTIGLVISLAWAGTALAGLVMRHARGGALLVGWGAAISLIVVAAVLAWSLFPRTRRFTPPGPELKRELHPALFKEIDRVAARCGVKGPRHVYLAPDVNAFVADVGGVLGLFTTRVLGLGLPLLHCLSLAELRAVLAHEFGHFAGGDTRIGHWVYRARAATHDIVEGLDGAAEVSASSDFVALTLFFALVRWPFVRFGHFYMRFTLALGRAQELAADALAAQLEGVEVLTRSLQKVRAASVGFDSYMQHEVVPLLSEGYLPPIGPGLSRFLDSPTVARQLERVATTMDREPEQEHDSHPPLSVRIAHARSLGLKPPRANGAVEGAAHELLTHRPELEMLMVARWVKGAPLKRVRWEDAGGVLERVFRSRATELAPALEGQTPASLPRERAAVLKLLEQSHGKSFAALTDDRLLLIAANTWSDVIVALLLDAGFTATSELGRPLRLTRGDESYEPVRLLHEYLFDGADAPWLAMWSSVGLTQAELGRVAPQA